MGNKKGIRPYANKWCGVCVQPPPASNSGLWRGVETARFAQLCSSMRSADGVVKRVERQRFRGVRKACTISIADTKHTGTSHTALHHRGDGGWPLNAHHRRHQPPPPETSRRTPAGETLVGCLDSQSPLLHPSPPPPCGFALEKTFAIVIDSRL